MVPKIFKILSLYDLTTVHRTNTLIELVYGSTRRQRDRWKWVVRFYVAMFFMCALVFPLCLETLLDIRLALVAQDDRSWFIFAGSPRTYRPITGQRWDCVAYSTFATSRAESDVKGQTKSWYWGTYRPSLAWATLFDRAVKRQAQNWWTSSKVRNQLFDLELIRRYGKIIQTYHIQYLGSYDAGMLNALMQVVVGLVATLMLAYLFLCRIYLRCRKMRTQFYHRYVIP